MGSSVKSNEDIKTLEKAKQETKTRAKFLSRLKSLTKIEQVVTQQSRDIAWKIVTSSLDWKQWQAEISSILCEESYPETVSALSELCFNSLCQQKPNGEGLYKFTKNLISSLICFSNQLPFKTAIRDSGIGQIILKFLSNKFTPNEDAKNSLNKCCLLLALTLMKPFSTSDNRNVCEDYLKLDGIKIISAFLDIKDDECRCVAALCLLKLLEKQQPTHFDANEFEPSSVWSLLLDTLSQHQTNGEQTTTAHLLNKVIAPNVEDLVDGVQGCFIFFLKSSLSESQKDEAKKVLSHLLENNNGCYCPDSCVEKIKTLQAKLSEASTTTSSNPKENDVVEFKENESLTTMEEAMSENESRVAFLWKLYELSPTSILGSEASRAIELLQNSYYDWLSRKWNMQNYYIPFEKQRFPELTMKIIDELFQDGWLKDTDNDSTYEFFRSCVSILWCLTDWSPEIRIQSTSVGLVDFFLCQLKDGEVAKKKAASICGWRSVFFDAGIVVLYNISRSVETKYKFLEQEATTILIQYFDVSEMTVIVSLCLAYIVDDTAEAAKLADERGIIQSLLDLASSAAQNTDKRVATGSGRFSLQELIDGIYILSKNDTNKVKLMECGILDLLQNVLVVEEGSKISSETSKEITRAIDVLWTLSFEPSVRSKIISGSGSNNNADPLKWLETLKSSSDSEIRQSANRALMFIQKWGDMANSSKKSSTNDGGRMSVFISYSHKQQDTVLQIKQFLESQDFKIYIDVEGMHGDLLDWMAKAVEKASVVLICFSQSYKDSNPCRAEAQYAYRLGKLIVPINLEYHYNPDGWLGMIVLVRMYIDLSLVKTPLDKALRNLLKEIHDVTDSGKNNELLPAGEAVPVTDSGRTHGELVTYQKPKNEQTRNSTNPLQKLECWSCDDVQKWLQEEKLNSRFTSKMSNFNGNRLATLLSLKFQAPEFFCATLDKHFNVPLPDLLDLMGALDKLATKCETES